MNYNALRYYFNDYFASIIISITALISLLLQYDYDDGIYYFPAPYSSASYFRT